MHEGHVEPKLQGQPQVHPKRVHTILSDAFGHLAPRCCLAQHGQILQLGFKRSALPGPFGNSVLRTRGGLLGHERCTTGVRTCAGSPHFQLLHQERLLDAV